MRNFEFIHIINYIIEKEIHIFVHENNYKIINHTDAAQFLVFCNMTLLFPDVYTLQDWNIKDYEPGKELRLNVSEYKIDDNNPLFYQDMQKEWRLNIRCPNITFVLFLFIIMPLDVENLL